MNRKMLLSAGSRRTSAVLASVLSVSLLLAPHTMADPVQDGAERALPPTGNDPASPVELPDNGGLPGKILDKMTLPNAFTTLIEIEDHEGLAALTAGNRFIFRGKIFDMATGEILTTVDDVRRAMADFSPERFGYTNADLQPLFFGNGEDEVILFVDPLCPFCQQLFDQLRSNAAYADLYRFTIYTVPFMGDQSIQAVAALSCTNDRDRAVDALFERDTRWYQTAMLDIETCDTSPIIARTMLSQQVGAAGTPFIISSSGRISVGMPADLFSFLMDE